MSSAFKFYISSKVGKITHTQKFYSLSHLQIALKFLLIHQTSPVLKDHSHHHLWSYSAWLHQIVSIKRTSLIGRIMSVLAASQRNLIAILGVRESLHRFQEYCVSLPQSSHSTCCVSLQYPDITQKHHSYTPHRMYFNQKSLIHEILAPQAKNAFCVKKYFITSVSSILVGKNISSKIKGKIAYLNKTSRLCENQQTVLFRLMRSLSSSSPVQRSMQFGLHLFLCSSHCHKGFYASIFPLHALLPPSQDSPFGNPYAGVRCKEIHAAFGNSCNLGILANVS